MNYYAVLCRTGNRRYSRIVKCYLACTRDEFVFEIARKAGVPALHIADIKGADNIDAVKGAAAAWDWEER